MFSSFPYNISRVIVSLERWEFGEDVEQCGFWSSSRALEEDCGLDRAGPRLGGRLEHSACA